MEEKCIACKPATKVRELLQILEEKLGRDRLQMIFDSEAETLKANIAIGLKRENMPRYQRLELFDGMDTVLQPHDSLIVFHPMGGG